MADEQKSPLDHALDLIVFAPVGLALTAKDELPHLVEKGRQRLGAQVMLAKMIGQFAISQGQKEAEKAAARLVEQAGSVAGLFTSPAGRGSQTAGWEGRGARGEGQPGEGSARTSPPAATPAGGAPVVTPGAAGRAPVVTPGAAGRAAAATSGARGSEESPNGNGRSPGAPAEADIPDEAQLAIPGYDSLSASHVVQRLAGLADGELDAVRRYELARRGRRTILSKIDQLQADRA